MNNNSNFKRFMSKLMPAVLAFSLIVTQNVAVFAKDDKVEKEKTKNDNHKHATGLKELTEEDKKWMKGNMIDTNGKTILLNELGLKRINESRKAKKQKELKNVPVVEFGDEVAVDMPGATATDENVSLFSVDSTQTLIENTLPGSVDNSQEPSFPPIRSQGGLGSCTCFSSTYYQMTHMAGLAMGWNTKDDNDNTNKFSPKWTYNFINSGENQGTNIAGVCKVLEKHGAPFWSDFEYDTDYREWSRDSSVWKKAINYRLDKMGYVDFKDGTDTPVTGPQCENLLEIKQLLNNGYVLNYSTFLHAWKYRYIKEGSYTGEKAAYMMELGDGDNGSHAMTLVGYDDNLWIDIDDDGIKEPGEIGAFKVANSHGKIWWNNGFGWIAYDALNKVSNHDPENLDLNPEKRYSIFRDDDLVWFTVRKNYSPKLIAEFKLTHPKRNELVVSLGYSNPGDETSTVTWKGSTLVGNGGPYAFDGSTTACQGSFALDFTDLYNTSDNGDGKWYLKVQDKYSANSVTLDEFKLVDNQKDREIYFIGQYPGSFSSDEIEISIDNTKDVFGFKGWKILEGLSTYKHSVATVGLNSMIYVFGGTSVTGDEFSTSRSKLDEVQAYDTYTHEWVSRPKLPVPMWEPQAAVAGDKIYVIDSIYNSNELYEYDPTIREWQLKNLDLYVDEDAVMVSLNNKIYFVGGTDILEYEPGTNVIRKLNTTVPVPVENFAAAALDGKIYIFGGDSKDGSQIRLKNVQEYNLIENRWTQKADLPEGKNGFKAQVLNGKIYTFGSESIQANMNIDSYIETIEEYDPLNDIWQQKGNMFYNIKDYSVTALGDRIYLAGGQNDLGGIQTKVFASYNPNPVVSSVPGRVEAEDFNSTSNVTFVENCSEGGQNLHWLSNGDKMEYYIDSAAAGMYLAKFRVASNGTGDKFKLTNGNDTLCVVDVPNTGGEQNWVTVSAYVTLWEGTHIINVESMSYDWSFNWMEFELVEKIDHLPGRIEAEDYLVCNEVCFHDTCNEGGEYIKWILDNDWMDYKVYIHEAGIYKVNFRVSKASAAIGGGLELKEGDNVLCAVTIPPTGGDQNWVTVSAYVELTGGLQELRVQSTVTNWSFNYMEFEKQ